MSTRTGTHMLKVRNARSQRIINTLKTPAMAMTTTMNTAIRTSIPADTMPTFRACSCTCLPMLLAAWL